MAQIVKKYGFCAFAPIATLGLVLIVFALYGLFPFGDNTLSWCDMNQQVLPILLDFKNILSGQSNLFLNMSNAGGMSFWGVLLFFISSPFSFLVIFVDPLDIYHFANILVLLKMMVCALTASLFLRVKFPNFDLLQNIGFSLMYAFCGYTMMYYQNVVWLDMMYLFPILLMGLHRLIEKQKILLFVFSFTAVMAVNFYLSYMVVIFLVLAFGVYIHICVPKENRKKIILLMAISTLLVALITAVFWLPSLFQYLDSARTVGLIESLSSGNFFAKLTTTLPILLCTAITVCAIPVACFTRQLKKPKVRCVFILFLLTLLPIIIEPINKMWHTGSYQAFPVRYGYMTVFLGLILLAMIISERNKNPLIGYSKANIWILVFLSIAVAGLVFLSWAFFSKQFDWFGDMNSYIRTLWMNQEDFGYFLIFVVIAALIYFGLLLLYWNSLLPRLPFSILLCVVVVFECLCSSSIFIGSASTSAQSYQAVLDLGKRIDDSSLYRVKNDKKYFDVNLVGAMGYNTLNHYTSLISKDYIYTMKKLGFSSYWMEVNSNGGTSFSDFLMANKYTITRNSLIDSDVPFLYLNQGYAIVENPLNQSFGVVFSSEDITSLRAIPDLSRMAIQNYLFQSLYQTEESLITQYEPVDENNLAIYSTTPTILSQTSYRTSELVYHCQVDGTQTLYFDCFHELSTNLVEAVNGSANVYVNGKLLETKYPSQKNNGLLNLGTFTDEIVTVRIELTKPNLIANSFGVFGLREDLLKQKIQSKPSVTFHQEKNTLIGTATAQGKQDYLFVPIVNQKGYTVTVNGNEVEAYTVFDAFMAVKLEQGENQITIRYMPRGFMLGVVLSIVGVCLLIGFLLLLYFGKFSIFHFLEKPVSLLFYGIFIFVFLMIYIFPVIIFIFV